MSLSVVAGAAAGVGSSGARETVLERAQPTTASSASGNKSASFMRAIIGRALEIVTSPKKLQSNRPIVHERAARHVRSFFGRRGPAEHGVPMRVPPEARDDVAV